jgi:MoaA/NifB/PqqE/SkfB family radical SAM enzyme
LLSKAKIKEIGKYLDWVSISLDGPDQKTDSLLRGREHFQKVVEALDILGGTNIRVKVNTMVGKPNINGVEKVGLLLDKFKCIKIWKLFQYTPRGNGLPNRDTYEISDRQFLDLSKTLKKQCHKFTVSPTTSTQRSGVYLLIQASGEMTIPFEENFIFIGNILQTTPEQALDEKTFDFSKHLDLADISYKLKK